MSLVAGVMFAMSLQKMTDKHSTFIKTATYKYLPEDLLKSQNTLRMELFLKTGVK